MGKQPIESYKAYKAYRNDSIDVLVLFYNLQIDPNLSNSGKRVLNRRDLRRIKLFFEKYAPYVFASNRPSDRIEDAGSCNKVDETPEDLEPSLIFKEITEKAKFKLDALNLPPKEEMIENLSIYKTMTLEQYEKETNCNWFQSDDIKAFMKDYLMVQCIIDDFLFGRFEYDKSKSWLLSLHRKLVDIRSYLLKNKSMVNSKTSTITYQIGKDLQDFFSVEEGLRIGKIEGGIYSASMTSDGSSQLRCTYINDPTLQLGKYRKIDTLFFSDPNKHKYYADWHGIGIYHIGQAIYEGLLLILKKEVIIRRCAVEGCNRIFRVKMRGGSKKTYCRESCRKKASKLRNTPTENGELAK